MQAGTNIVSVAFTVILFIIWIFCFIVIYLTSKSNRSRRRMSIERETNYNLLKPIYEYLI